MNQRIELSDQALQKLKRFELELRPADPAAGPFGPRIIGYGEMSTVFAFDDQDLRGVAFKRMALFEAAAEAEKYSADYLEYNRLLIERGINIPDYGCHVIPDRENRTVLYLSQEMLNPDFIGHRLLFSLSDADIGRLFGRVLEYEEEVFGRNRKDAGLLELGFDGQLSNWALIGPDAYAGSGVSLPESFDLCYLDTSTPLMRKNGVEQLDPELFLRICPTSLVWIIRMFFLKDVVNRYYDFRLVILDAIANLLKEGREDLVEPLLRQANDFLSGRPGADRDNPPVTLKEVRSYYKEDALIWTLFLSFRRMERFLRTKILRKEYRLILPGKIKR